MWDIGSILKTAASRLVVRSALNPLLYLCVLFALPVLVLATTVHDDPILRWVLVGLGFLPLGVTLAIALRFGFVCPENLRSEKYHLQQQALLMLQGATAPEVLDAHAVVAVATANPEVYAALPEATGGEQQ